MVKISALPPLASVANDDEMPIVDDSAAATKKFTIADLKAIFCPVGTVDDFAGATAPTGWLLCYGQAVSRTDYADLFAVIGTDYGSGDGSTTFNVPDLRGRVVAGQDDMGGSSANRLTGLSGGVDGDTLGAAGGAETHTLTTAQMPSHSHSQYTNAAGGGLTRRLDDDGLSGSAQAVNQGQNTGDAGSGGAHNNVQPTMIMNKIIKY